MSGRRKIKKWASVAAAAVFLLTGCASGEVHDSSEAAVRTTTVVTEAVTETAETSAAETDPVQTATTTPATTTTTTAAQSEPAGEEPRDPNAEVYAKAAHVNGLRFDPTDKKGVYEIKGLAEDMPGMEFHNGIALVFGYIEGSEKEYEYDGKFYGNCTIRAYDIKRGLLLGETDSRSTGYYCYNEDLCGAFDGGFYSCEGNKARLFDIGMNVTAEFTLPARKCTKIWVSRDGRYILLNEKGSPTRLYDTANRREVELSQNVKALSVLARSNGYFDVIDKKDRRFRINTGGKVVPFGTMSMPDYYHNTLDLLRGKVLEVTPAGICLRDPERNTAKLIEYQPDKIQYIMYADERYITFCDDNNDTQVIDVKNGMISEPIGQGSYGVSGSSPDGSFVFFDGEENSSSVTFMLAVPSELEYKKKADIRQVDLTEDEYTLYFKKVQPNSERAVTLLEELSDRYNVRVMFAPVYEKEKYFGYYIRAYKGDQAPILEKIRDFLALSPPGLLTEAGDGEETWILICSDIVDDPELSSYGTAGFTAVAGLHPFVALETPMNEKQAKEATGYTGMELYDYFAEYVTDNLSHEFIHILDSKTTATQTARWEALSPKDCYFGTYESMKGGDAEEYITFKQEYDDGVYFTDKYGRINPLEDKARVGEYLYYAGECGLERALDKFACSRPLYRKARLLSEIFRENYPCLASVPEGEWYLEKPLMGSYGKLKKQHESGAA